MSAQNPISTQEKFYRELIAAIENRKSVDEIDAILDKAREEGIPPWEIINYNPNPNEPTRLFIENELENLRGKTYDRKTAEEAFVRINKPISFEDYKDLVKNPKGAEDFAKTNNISLEEYELFSPILHDIFQKLNYKVPADFDFATGYHPILRAILTADIRVVTKLLERSPTLDSKEPHSFQVNGEDLLVAMITAKDINKMQEILKVMIEHGFDPKRKNQRSIRNSKSELMSFLEALDYKDKRGSLNEAEWVFHIRYGAYPTEEERENIKAIVAALKTTIQETPNRDEAQKQGELLFSQHLSPQGRINPKDLVDITKTYGSEQSQPKKPKPE